MAILLAHLLKWEHQPERRGASWQLTIRNQRKAVLRRLEDMPSLKGKLVDNRWLEAVWSDAVIQAATETGLSDFPEECP
jgi:hypothetical protein